MSHCAERECLSRTCHSFYWINMENVT
uniref:Uncharacterized protein n=1 Tax=Anguilla anguilla TaxID=7936 RepID=A0A0E9TXH8_ANGAN